jgi:outer membrane protein TolC
MVVSCAVMKHPAVRALVALRAGHRGRRDLFYDFRGVCVSKQLFATVAVACLLAGCSVKPMPLLDSDIQGFAADRLDRVTADQEPVSGAISLYEAMARALKYNLDAKVEVMETALREKELNLAHYDLLPRLVASSGYAGRTNTEASSVSIRDGELYNADLTFSWNILDFGLSYVRAHQAADKVLIQEEMKRKIVNRVIEDVRTAYWRAASYERLAARMHRLEGRVGQALQDTRELAASGNTSPIAALTYERELLQIKREIEILEEQLKVSKSQLAALMNIEPGTQYTLATPKRAAASLNLPGNLRAMFRSALENRPEMREIAYELRINDDEMDAALLQLLPGLQLYAGANYDSNDFLTDASWLSWGAKASWNLLKVFSLPATQAKVDAQGTLLDTRSLSVAMAIMTQVHVSRVRFLHISKEFKTAAALASVQHRLLDKIRAETAAQRTSEQILIREEMNALVADAKLDMVYADLQNAYANVYSSLGLDPFPAGIDNEASVKSMAASLKGLWIERGAGGPQVLAGN